jgi:hypothetical protein
VTRIRLFSATILTVFVSGCGSELGKCEEPAAKELVYGRGNLVATKGQALIHDSCGQGAFCHSSAAKRSARQGAPATLDFDMVPRAIGLANVLRNRELIWDSIVDRTMPPKGYAVGDSDWSFSITRGKDEARLPAIHTDEGKAIVRNWLACGAPIVTDTGVPSWVQAGGGLGDGSWSDLHRNLIAPRCAISGCHDARGASLSGNLDLTESCASRAALLKTGTCGQVRVKPGDASSFLIDKIESTTPRCGSRSSTERSRRAAPSHTLIRLRIRAETTSSVETSIRSDTAPPSPDRTCADR